MRIRQLLGILLTGTLIILALFSSCGGGLRGDELALDPITVAFPFIEAVHVPAQIHAGQPFEIKLDLSSQLNPGALRSPERPFPNGDLFYDSYAGSFTVSLRPFRDLSFSSTDQPYHESITYQIMALPAGEHKLRILTAPSRDQGGLLVTVDKTTWSALGDLTGMLHEQAFTVLP